MCLSLHRRWYQWRLRSLLLLMLVAACGAWLVALQLQRLEWQRQQRAALAQFSSWRGQPVTADAVELELFGHSPDAIRLAVYLPRLERLTLGLGVFHERDIQRLTQLTALRSLELKDAKATPAAFAALGHLRRLEHLDLRGTPVDAQALEQVARLRRLKSLVLNTPRDRAAWQHLKRLTQLQSLRIMKGGLLRPGDLRFLSQMPNLRVFWLQASVEGDTLADLEHVPQLTELRLQANFLHDGDLTYITGHTRLKHLTLEANGGGAYTDEGLAVVANFPELTFLNLSHCRGLTDRGLAHVRGLAQLRTLRLTGTSVTDQGLVHLVGLQRLVNLHVDYTAVTPAGLARLGPRPQLRTLKIGGPSAPDDSFLRQQFANAAIE